MRKKSRTLGSRILSAALAAVMSLSLAMSPLPGMFSDQEGETVEAATSTGEEIEGAIYFPITLRDARANMYFFQNNNKVLTADGGTGDDKGGFVNEFLNETTRTPEHTAAAKAQVAAAIKEIIAANGTVNKSGATYPLTHEKYNDTVLNKAIEDQITDRTTLNQNSKDYDGSFKSIRNYYDAACWITGNAFTDATLTDAPTTNPDEMYMYKDLTYHTLLLKKNYNSSGKWDGSYSYSAKQAANATTKPLGSKLDATSGIIQNDTSSDPMGWCGDSSKKNYLYCGWYPLTGLGYEKLYKDYADFDFNNRNFHFTTSGNGKFVYHSTDNLFFEFSGDDDVYLYIGKGSKAKLVIDIGGTHSDTRGYVALESKVNASTNVNVSKYGKNSGDQTWAQYLGLKDGETYDFYFFQMERNKFGSNFSMRTNINVVNAAAYPEKTAYQNGAELDYGAYIEENSEVEYGFKMTNYSDSDCFGTENLRFQDSALGINLCSEASEITLGTYTDAKGVNHERAVTDLSYAIYPEGEKPSGYTKITSVDELANILRADRSNGRELKQGYTIEIRGFKYNILKGGTDKSFTNTIKTSATGLIGNTATPTEVTLHGSAKMKLNTTSFVNKVFVIDYAKPMTLTIKDVFENKVSENIVNELDITDTKVKAITLKDGEGDYGDVQIHSLVTENGDTSEVTWGSIIKKYNQDLLTYTPKAVISGGDTFSVNVQLLTKPEEGKEPVESQPLTKPLTVIPANNVYYEDTFVSSDENNSSLGIVYTGTWDSVKAPNDERVTEEDTTVNNNKESVGTEIHGGWQNGDLSDDKTYTDGSAHKTEFVSGQKAKASFTFTGTGVDIYSRTNLKTGTILVTLKSDAANATPVNKFLIIDNLSESGDYYQIPTATFNSLPHGKYTVDIMVSMATDKNENGTTTTRGTYYLDGIRVYNPINTVNTTDTALKESYGVKNLETNFTTVRDILLGQKDFSSNEDVTGAVFIDSTDENNSGYEAGVLNGTIKDYEDFGPKNEVYLKKNQSIAFKVTGTASAYYVGLKSPTGLEVKAKTYVPDGNDATKVDEYVLDHVTDLYYEVCPDSNGYIVITNTTDNMLAITKLCTAGLDGNNDVYKVNATEVTNAVYALRKAPIVVRPSVPDVEIENPEIKYPDFSNIVNGLIKKLQKLVTTLFAGFDNWF